MTTTTTTTTTKTDRLNVRVDLDTFRVYDDLGPSRRRKHIGTVLSYVVNEGARTPTGGRFVSRRLSVRLRGDDRMWVGQFRNGEKRTVRLRVLEEAE